VEPNKCQLVVSTMDGKILVYDIMDLFRNNDISLYFNSSKKNNYNPYRKIKDDFQNSVQYLKAESIETIINLYQNGNITDLSSKVVLNIEAHRDIITSI